MDERHRFAVALAGVTGCLCLAAGIALSGPDDAAVPSVDRPQAARLEPLPRWPVPAWTDVPAPTAQRPATSLGSRELVGAAAVVERQSAWATAPAQQLAPLTGSRVHGFTGSRVHGFTGSRVPDTVGAAVVVAQERTHRHGAVTGAFVTAGARVGGSVRTVGRTLRRVF